MSSLFPISKSQICLCTRHPLLKNLPWLPRFHSIGSPPVTSVRDALGQVPFPSKPCILLISFHASLSMLCALYLSIFSHMECSFPDSRFLTLHFSLSPTSLQKLPGHLPPPRRPFWTFLALHDQSAFPALPNTSCNMCCQKHRSGRSLHTVLYLFIV